MTLYLGNQPIAGISTKTKYNAHTLLDFKWSDHILSDISWLRADTFSWQDGSVYVAVYNYLASSIQGATTKTEQGVTFYECENGLRIALANQESNVLSAYNTTGVAWYYILDTDNTRFKLPRTKYGFVGLRDEVGKFVDESLPNITGSQSLSPVHKDANFAGALQCSKGSANIVFTSGSWISESTVTFDASRSSSTYQNNASVQQKSTQMYLYFYVGEYSQTAIEQTAGITAEQLNAKVDVASLTEINPMIVSYVNGSSGYNIWSNGYCEQWGRFYSDDTSNTTVTFLKTFKDTNYLPLVGQMYGSSGNDTYWNYAIYTISANSMVIHNATNGSNTCIWKACGYLAEGEY